MFLRKNLITEMLKIANEHKSFSLSNINTAGHSWNAMFQALKQLEEKGYLKSFKQGRKRIFTLTDKGKKTIELIKQLEEA